MRRILWAVGIVGAFGVVSGCPLTPCECPDLGGSVGLAAPADGATGVLVDTMIWAGASQAVTQDIASGANTLTPATLQLTGPSGPVAGTTGTLTRDGDQGPAALTFLQPSGHLAPNTTYKILLNGTAVSSFTTGTATAGAPPPIPTVSVATQTYPAGECLTKTEDITVDQPGLFVVVQLPGEEAAFMPPTFAGQVAQIVTGTSVEFSAGRCGNSSTTPAQARFGAIDIAGKFSGWSAWQNLTASTPDQPDTTCSADAGPSGALSCSEVLSCVSASSCDACCAQACVSAASTAATTFLTTLAQCVDHACDANDWGPCEPGNPVSECTTCQAAATAGACASEHAACLAN